MIINTVGPSKLYPTVSRHIQSGLKRGVCSISHRGKEFHDLSNEVSGNIRKLLTIPNEYHIFFLSSGTECMERIIQNMVLKNSLHLVNGAFSNRFYQTAIELRKKPQCIEVKPGESFKWSMIRVPKKAELICFTHNETSTGVMLPLDEIYSMSSRNPDALIAIDSVSSTPYVNIHFQKVDAVFFSVQKGFGLPAGLAVLIVSPRALEKAAYIEKQGFSTGSFHSFSSLQKYSDSFETPETPNVFSIYSLGEVVKDMLKKKISVIRKEIDQKAELLDACINKSSKLSYLVQDANVRSKTVFVLKVEGGSEDFIKTLKKRGCMISSGYGAMKKEYVRIANFPAHSTNEIAKLIHEMNILR